MLGIIGRLGGLGDFEEQRSCLGFCFVSASLRVVSWGKEKRRARDFFSRRGDFWNGDDGVGNFGIEGGGGLGVGVFEGLGKDPGEAGLLWSWWLEWGIVIGFVISKLGMEERGEGGEGRGDGGGGGEGEWKLSCAEEEGNGFLGKQSSR